MSEWDRRRYVPAPGEPELPPQLADLTNKPTEEVMRELNRLPFFMTEIDETNGDGGSNIELDALKALAYDGEPDEIATNFKNQGNEAYKTKQYKHAVEFYTKGLDVGCDVQEIEISLYLNRAACNLELKNYGRCIADCKSAFQLDAKNVKACYRTGRALFAVERYDEAQQILQYGLTIEPENTSLQQVLSQVTTKKQQILDKQLKKQKEEEERQLKNTILKNAINLRHMTLIDTPRPAELLKNSTIRLEDPQDYESQLIFPGMILYPSTDEFDFIAELSELVTPVELLEMLLDRPKEWLEDPKHANFTVKRLECYMETEAGGLIKVGKKVPINTALTSEKPKVPLFDKSLRMYVIPKSDSAAWLETWDKNVALAKRTKQ